ncbi:SDR family oxidoreductase [Actinosynnema sp. NPDC023587]|uniref:SDR family oxidoreductase n=1 Tax=Actinosynnema sp. NPDC023587 TaxID=3154695 RepID=UPI0033D288FD
MSSAERSFRLTATDVAAFAAASGDHNPSHVDVSYARRTPSGAPTAHDALGVLAALAPVPADVLARVVGVTARFAQPVAVDAAHRVVVDGTSVSVRRGDVTAMSIALTTGDPDAAEVFPAAVALPGEPEADGIAAHPKGSRLDGPYGVPDPAGLRQLAHRLGADAVPPWLLGALAWTSRLSGMTIPGRDALVSGLRLRRGDGAATGRYRAEVRTADERSGAVVVDAVTGPVEAEIRAFQRRPVPGPTRRTATSVLPAGEALAGKHVLVVGGSRGIGSHVVSVLAAQGATVWATERTAGAVAALRREFGDAVRPVRLDATDPDAVRAAFDLLAGQGVRLDGLVLSAGPPIPVASLHVDEVPGLRGFLDTSATSALLPLTAALAHLRPGAWLAVLSSGAVLDTPAGRPQYVMAKAALEALGRYCADHHGLRVLLARAPKMWTDMSNGPMGRVGTVPTERVASAIVGWVLRDGEQRLTVLSPEELAGRA